MWTMSVHTRIGGWLAAFLALSAACAGSPDEAAPEDCIPNQQISCSCPGGGLGVRQCAADGSGYGACTGCAAATEGCSSEPDCGGCSSCFDSCVCQGGDAKACLTQCSGGGGASPGGGGTSGVTGGSGGVSASSGGSGGSAGGGGAGGGAVLDCQSCVAQSCGSELSGCTQTSGCLELVQCASQNGCALSDYGCLLLGCGALLVNFKAVVPAMSLGGCAAQACAVECA